MIVTSDFLALPRGERVFAIGNFDGVHLGHQALFRRAVALASSRGGTAIALAFHPHPLQVLGYSVETITDDDQKVRLIADHGVSAYFAMPFGAELAAMTPERFVSEVLIEQAAASAVVVGYNFSFGKGGAGTPEFLAQALAAHNVPVDIVAPVLIGGEAVSSTLVRQCIRSGDLDRAATLLGRPYSLSGLVLPGDQRGRTIGYPTANLYNLQGLALPPFGVYAAEVLGIGPGMANLGIRPSFPQAGPSLEVNILDWQGNLYGSRIDVVLRRFLRGERRFEGLAALQQQLASDRLEVKRLLGRY